MEFSCLPGDMVRLLARWLPIVDVKGLFMTNRTMHREVHDHMDFWRLKYLEDYGDPHTLDDLVGYDWREKYRFRHGMDRVREICETTRYTSPPIVRDRIIHGKQVVDTGTNRLVIVNMDDTIDIIGSDGGIFHYDVRVMNVIVLHPIDTDRSTLCALTTDNRMLYGYLYGPLVDSNLDDIMDIYNNTTYNRSFVTMDTDHNLTLRSIHSGKISSLPLRLKAKGFARALTYAYIIDMDDNVWYAPTPQGTTVDLDWVQIPNIKGRSVSAFMGAIITDLDDNLWGFGYNPYRNLGIGDVWNAETPIRLGITGRRIYMGASTTIVVDIDHNVWFVGSNVDGMSPITSLFDRVDTDIINVPKMVPNFKGIDAQTCSSYIYLIGDYY